MHAVQVNGWMTKDRPALSDLTRTRIALEQLLDGIDEWKSEHSRTAFVDNERDHGVLVEINDALDIRVSCWEKFSGDTEEHAAWNVRLDDSSMARGVFDDAGRPLTGETVRALNDILWSFHRLAVEDAVTVLRG